MVRIHLAQPSRQLRKKRILKKRESAFLLVINERREACLKNVLLFLEKTAKRRQKYDKVSSFATIYIFRALLRYTIFLVSNAVAS